MQRWYYTPAQVGPLLGWNPHYVRLMARDNPDGLPFKTVRHGTRTQIERIPFNEWYLAAGGDPARLDEVIP